MSEAPGSLRTGTNPYRGSSRPLGIFASWRLQAYGYTIAALYTVLLFGLYKTGFWIVDGKGVPVYSDFITPWIAGVQALHGDTAPIYDPAKFAKLQEALVGPKDYFYPNWPYPPTFFFALIPFAMLPYACAFVVWDFVTLASCVTVTYLIVRRRPAIALVLASPLTAWTVFAGQNALLWASLLGGSLLAQRRQMLAGVLIGCLTFKPQFGILLPVALAAANQWRAFASAAVTAGVLAGASVAAFGTKPWAEFPRELAAQSSLNLFAAPDSPYWGYQQTVYGVIRYLHGGAPLGWLLHSITAVCVVVIVWLVWRSPVRYALKAATLSAAAIIVTPYAFATDMAAIVVPFAFLATDQIEWGLLRGEQTIMITLFGAALVILIAVGSIPLGPIILIALLAIILRRSLLLRPELRISADVHSRPLP